MCTIVIHGTMTHKAARNYKWWWDSWGPKGFLFALASGMQEAGGSADVWTIGGVHVSQVPQLNPKRNFWIGTIGQFAQHRGHFIWDGADMGPSRDAAAVNLVKYLNTLQQISPNEPIRIVAHSHGCNVVKLASSSKRLSAQVYIDQAVFLACPHFQGVDKITYTYKLNPNRFGRILNLYSPYDSVQTQLAENITGMPGPRLDDYIPVKSFRTDQNPVTAKNYENWEIPTVSRGIQAHSDMHGGVMGYMSGRWLAGNSFNSIVKDFAEKIIPIPAGDQGE